MHKYIEDSQFEIVDALEGFKDFFYIIPLSKKDLYLKAATEYFDRYGYKSFKISHLAKELEISVGTIYNLFTSKENLYLEYLISKLQNFLDTLKSKETNNPKENLELYLSCKYEIFIQIDDNTTDPYFFHKLDISNHPIVDEIYEFLIRQFKQLYPNKNINYKIGRAHV